MRAKFSQTALDKEVKGTVDGDYTQRENNKEDTVGEIT
jgi:hypothetical protein